MGHYKIVVSVDSIEISSHNKKWFEAQEVKYKDVIMRLLGTVDTLLKKENTKIAVPPTKNNLIDITSMTLDEFYRTYIYTKITVLPDIVTLFIYYLSKVGKNTDIQSKDVKEQFKKVRYPSWKDVNVSEALNKAKSKAFLNKDGRVWSLTTTGEDFVSNTLKEINDKPNPK